MFKYKNFSQFTIYIFAGLFSFHLVHIQAQKTSQGSFYASPLNIPLFLSGNFGETRSVHFHSGVDFKTEQVTGKQVFAAADGYISRVKIQTNSYGKSLYITHPNGNTTVYAHLMDFNPEISGFVKELQYKNRSFEVDAYLQTDKFIVKKGMQIGISGNTGNSGGPHLHFEIRNPAQEPMNVLSYNFNVTDNISPVIENLAIYPVDNESSVDNKPSKLILKPLKKNGMYYLKESPVTVNGNIGFGVETDDYLNGSGNKCAVYSIELLVDDTIYYFFEMDAFSFDEGGYVKSHVDYEERLANNREIQKLYVDQNNRLRNYKIIKNHGILKFKDDSLHLVKIVVNDVYRNSSVLSFYIRAKSSAQSVYASENDSSFIRTFYYTRENNYSTPDIKIFVPENALFKNINFKYSKYTEKDNAFSDLHFVHTEYEPLFKSFEISIRSKNLDENLRKKALIVTLDKKNAPESIGGEWKDGFVSAGSKNFGKFFIMVDTVAPAIIPEKFRNNSFYNLNDTLVFKIEDELSGIKSYNGIIDGQWALFEYDGKSNTIFYVIDPSHLGPLKKHILELKITDNKENINIFKGTFSTN